MSIRGSNIHSHNVLISFVKIYLQKSSLQGYQYSLSVDIRSQKTYVVSKLKCRCVRVKVTKWTCLESHVVVFIYACFSGLVSEPAMKFCSESVSPYLASILEELMAPVSSGFQAVRQRLETELNRICKDFQPGGTKEELTKVRLGGWGWGVIVAHGHCSTSLQQKLIQC